MDPGDGLAYSLKIKILVLYSCIWLRVQHACTAVVQVSLCDHLSAANSLLKLQVGNNYTLVSPTDPNPPKLIRPSGL